MMTEATITLNLARKRRNNPRNTQNASAKSLRPLAAPEPPIVADALLTGPEITFIQFLEDSACQHFCRLLFGRSRTSAGAMLQEFRKAVQFHYYGHRRAKAGGRRPTNPGKLTESKAATKKLLKSFARLAYRGDPDKRGVLFWERVAWLLWDAYSSLMALRHRAEKIKQQEELRIRGLSAKRSKRAAYMRRYRSKRAAKESSYFKEESKQRWRVARRHAL